MKALLVAKALKQISILGLDDGSFGMRTAENFVSQLFSRSKMVPLEGIMRRFRFSAFLAIMVLSSVAWTQTSNPATTQAPTVQSAQTPATAPAAPAAQNEEPRNSPKLERKLIGPFQVAEDFRKQIDRGIRLNPVGAGTCGSIVSYNFSAGAPDEAPRLESVTTCTPADKVVQRHAQNPTRKQTPPQLLKINSPER